MNKEIIEFTANNGQQLKLTSPIKTYASDTINYIEAHFKLADYWREYDRIAAIWYCKAREPYTSYIDSDGITIIPPEALTKPGTLIVNLCATTAENGIIKARLTSEPVKALLLTKTKI